MIKKIFKLGKSGFSMAEMLVTVLIFSILIGGIYASLAVGEASWETNKVKIELQQELRKAMEWMKFDLQQAGPTSITNVPADDTWYTTITFKTPNGVSGGSINWEADTMQFVLGGTGSTQLQKVQAGTTTVLAQNIKTLNFRRSTTNSNILEISMLAEKNTVKGDTINYQLDFEVQIRN